MHVGTSVHAVPLLFERVFSTDVLMEDNIGRKGQQKRTDICYMDVAEGLRRQLLSNFTSIIHLVKA